MTRSARRPGDASPPASLRIGGHRRRAGLLAAAVALTAIVAALWFGASGASAHAMLMSTTPQNGAVLATPPTSVSATFDEAVGISADSVRVFAPDGSRVDSGPTVQGANPDVVTVPLRGGLGTGTYTVAWQVVSADSHPIQGAFTFSVGAASATKVATGSALLPTASHALGLAYGAVRWLAFACFALLVGAVAFVLLCWPGGASRRGVVRIAGTGWIGLFAATLATVPLQGAYGYGTTFTRALHGDMLHRVLDTRLGEALNVRVMLLGLAGIMLAVWLSRLPSMTGGGRFALGTLWLVVTAAIAATWSSADHSSVGPQVRFALPADIVHLVAMGFWIGGLVVLVCVLLRDRDPAEAQAAVPRFSTLALLCVAAILGTGVYQSWREVGTLHGLTSTPYGRLVLLKAAGLIILMGLGLLARIRIRYGLRRSTRRDATAATAEDTAAVADPTPTPRRATASGGLFAPDTVVHRGGATGLVAYLDDEGYEMSNWPGTGDLPAVPPGDDYRPRTGTTPSRSTSGATRAPATEPETRRRRGDGAAEQAVRRLRRSVAVEVVVAAAVLGVAALLVNTDESRNLTAASGMAGTSAQGSMGAGMASGPAKASVPYDTGAATGTIAATVTPDTVGQNTVDLVLTDRQAMPYTPVQLTVSATLQAKDIGPLPVAVVPVGPGHFRSAPTPLTFSGQWQLTVVIRSDDFDEATVGVPFTMP